MNTWTHSDILPEDPGPAVMQTRRLNVSPTNPNLIVQGTYFRVTTDLSRAPLRNYLLYGFESERDFSMALRELLDLWGGRIGEAVSERSWMGCEGEAIDQRHRAIRLIFHDTPGGCPDEAWLPLYLLDFSEVPEYCHCQADTPEELISHEIDEAIGLSKQ